MLALFLVGVHDVKMHQYIITSQYRQYYNIADFENLKNVSSITVNDAIWHIPSLYITSFLQPKGFVDCNDVTPGMRKKTS